MSVSTPNRIVQGIPNLQQVGPNKFQYVQLIQTSQAENGMLTLSFHHNLFTKNSLCVILTVVSQPKTVGTITTKPRQAQFIKTEPGVPPHPVKIAIPPTVSYAPKVLHISVYCQMIQHI